MGHPCSVHDISHRKTSITGHRTANNTSSIALFSKPRFWRTDTTGQTSPSRTSKSPLWTLGNFDQWLERVRVPAILSLILCAETCRYYTMLSTFLPIQVAVSSLGEIYSVLIPQLAPGGPSNHLLPTPTLRLSYGQFWIEFRSDRLPLTWHFLNQFFSALVEVMEQGFVGTFTAALSHAETDVTVWVRMGVISEMAHNLHSGWYRIQPWTSQIFRLKGLSRGRSK